MSKKITIILLLSISIIFGSEISISISENLVNDYLKLIGNHEVPKGPKNDQAIWSIKNPEVKFEHGSAEFFTTITYKKGKTNIKKSIKKNILKLKEQYITKKIFQRKLIIGKLKLMI